MKKLLLVTFSSFLLYACSSIEKDARRKIEQFISENANDAKSYEFISMGKPDTLKLSDSLSVSLNWWNDIIKLHQLSLRLSSEQVDSYEKYRGVKPTYAYISYERNKKNVAEDAEEVKKDSMAIQEIKSMIDNIKANPELNKDLSIHYTLNFRIRNIMGGLYKTNAKIIYYPQNQTWSGVEIANPLDGLLEK